MGLLAFLLLGLVGAVIAKAILPGREDMGFLTTLIVGVIGAFLGGWLVAAMTGNDPMDGFFDLSSWIAAIVGSMLVLWIFGMVRGGNHDRV